MAEITFPYAPGFADVPGTSLAAEQYAQGVLMGRIVENAAFGMVRPEVFVTKQKHGDTVPLPVSATDGYQYSRDELIYAWSVQSTANPDTGQNSVIGWGGRWWFGQWFVDQTSGLVTVEKWYDDNYGNSQQKTNDGVLLVYTIASRRKSSLTMSSQPFFEDVADSEFGTDKALHETPLRDTNRNAKYSVVASEAIYMGTYKSTQQVSLPTSPVDGYAYQQSEITWLWSWVWTTDGDTYAAPVVTVPVIGNILTQLNRLTASVDADGTVHCNVHYYNDHDIDLGDTMGRIAVIALCTRGGGQGMKLTDVVQYAGAGLPQGPADWIVSGNSAIQVNNADPSILLSDLTITNAANDKVTGVLRVPSTSVDDDFIGFVFGYQDSSHFYLFDWRKATQTDPDGTANIGMKVKKVSAASDPTAADLWPNAGSAKVSILYTNAVPWAYNVNYRFTLQLTATGFTITVENGTTVLATITIADTSYTSGRFGFYNFSQDSVSYAGFFINPTSGVSFAGAADFAWIDTAELAPGDPDRTDLMVQLLHNIRYATLRPEFFDAGDFNNGDTVPVPTSTIDGYVYSRDEIVYLYEMGDTGPISGNKVRILSWSASINQTTGLVSITELHLPQGGSATTDHQGTIRVKIIAVRSASHAIPDPSTIDSSGGGGGSSTGSGNVNNGGLDDFSGSGQTIGDGWTEVSDAAGARSYAQEAGLSPVGSSQGITVNSGAGNLGGIRNARSAVCPGDRWVWVFRAAASVAITTGFKARLRFWDTDATTSVTADVISGALGTSTVNELIGVQVPANGDSTLWTGRGTVSLSATLTFVPAWVDLEFVVSNPNVNTTVSIDDVDWYLATRELQGRQMSTGNNPADGDAYTWDAASLSIKTRTILGAVDARTSTTETIAKAAWGECVTLANASAIAVTLDSTVPNHFMCFVQNRGAGTATLTPSSGQIDDGSGSASSKTLSAGQSCSLFFDGTDWRMLKGAGGSTSPTTTEGDIIVRGSSGDQRLGIGTNGQVLTVDTALSGKVKWSGSPGANGWTKVEEHVGSDVSSIAFTTGISSSYDEYELILMGVTFTNAILAIQFSTDGGSTYDAGSNYAYMENEAFNTGSGGGGSTGTTSLALRHTSATTLLAGSSWNARFMMLNLRNASIWKCVRGEQAYTTTTPNYVVSEFVGYWKNTSAAANAFRVTISSGTMSGTFRLYGR